jgi:penicillin-binding protein 2
MNRLFYNRSRIIILGIALAVILIVYASAMYNIQVLSRADAAGSGAVTTRYSTVTASRGKILDRNGVELVTSRARYSVTVDRSAVLAQDEPNDVIYGLITAAMATNTSYNDTFPVTSSGPFEYRANMTDNDRERLDTYFEYFGLESDISASDLIVWMREHYGIDYLTNINDARLIIGVRYELEIRVIMNGAEYVFADDVDLDFITRIKEYNYPGVTVVTKWDREYETDYASHILGYVGLMNAEEYEKYKEKGYPMDATVGKEGVESAFEDYLHGVDGVRATVTDADGNVVDTYMETEAQAGGNVFLSIDYYLQKTAEDALKETIDNLNAERGSEAAMADGGAVVVKDVHSGETLALASYPTYDLSTLQENYTELLNDPTMPLFNRATQGTYSPGSTFKMVTAYAGLVDGTISRYTTVVDQGIYTRYRDYQPKCWVYPSNHGVVDVVGALAKSCNYFFYWLGDTMGIEKITEAAENFGFGQKTGIEITESTGTVFSVDYKENTLGEDWYAADTLITAIGQRDLITPVQLANYVSSIANNGTLYRMTLFDRVMNEDYTKTLIVNEPEVLKTIEGNHGYLSILREGMEAVASSGTAEAVFADYPVKIAAKTGTVESETSKETNAVFVCFAPADDPQIAICVVVENGGHGSSIIPVAKALLDSYFSTDYSTALPIENTMQGRAVEILPETAAEDDAEE